MKLMCVHVCDCMGEGGGEESASLVLRQPHFSPPKHCDCEHIKCSLGMGKLHAKMSTSQSMQLKRFRCQNQTFVKSKTCFSGGSGNKTSKELSTYHTARLRQIIIIDKL